jgi:hypothetical protein
VIAIGKLWKAHICAWDNFFIWILWQCSNYAQKMASALSCTLLNAPFCTIRNVEKACQEFRLETNLFIVINIKLQSYIQINYAQTVTLKKHYLVSISPMFTCSFYACRSRKRKNTVKSSVSFLLGWWNWALKRNRSLILRSFHRTSLSVWQLYLKHGTKFFLSYKTQL